MTMDDKKRILVVEDEAIVAENLRRTLEDAGFLVPAIARNGGEAMEMIRRHRPGLVLMDIVLEDSDRDGIELQKAIREEFSLPVIFLTALSDRGILDKAKDTYSYGYLLKPVNEKELVIAIETALKRHELEEALRRSEEMFRTIFESSPIGIELYGPDGTLLHANGSCLDIFGVESVETVRGFNLFEDPNVSEEHRQGIRLGNPVRYETLFDFDRVRKLRLYETSRSGSAYLDVLITPLHIGGRGAFHGYLVHVQDITSRKIYENTLQELSLIDQLTGLYNRRGFLKLASQHAGIAGRNGTKMSVIFIDLNNMKRINDTHGHPEGDRALIQAAGALRKTFRTTDVLARWGGDEFAVLMVNAKDGSDDIADKRLERSIAEVNAEGLLKEPLGLSWGIVRFDPELKESIEDVVARADREMYRHKRREN
jgi:diguanylate cyclase (GGDEF)-like protein/PAS domain S-box-containing protein